jgi:hypothetical protein
VDPRPSSWDERDWTVTPDVIESHAAPPVGRRVAVGVIATALLVWLAYHASRPDPSDQSALAPSEPPVAAMSPDPRLPGEPLMVDELVAGIDLGTLVVPTRPPQMVDTVRRTSQPISGLPAAPGLSYGVADLGGGRFLVTARDPYPATEAFLVTTASGVARPVVTGDDVIPGADGVSVLVTRMDRRGLRSVQRYGLDGGAVGAPVTLRQDEAVTHDTVAGWLFVSWNGWQLRDPATGAERGRYRTPLAAAPTVLAYTAEGGVTVVGLDTGSVEAPQNMRWIAVPEATSLVAAVFQPAGRHLALHAVDPATARHSVLVLDLVTGKWSTLPGTPVRLAARTEALSLSWSGDVLSVVVPDGTVVLWRPGSPTAYAAPATGDVRGEVRALNAGGA